MFVNRSGEMRAHPPGEMVKIPDGVDGLNEYYLVELFTEVELDGHEFKKLGQEIFSKYPSKNQIMWALAKYNAHACSVRKIYEFNYDY